MDKIQVSELLKKLGLNKKESSVFLFLISRGPSTAGTISRQTQITRTHIYDIAESLKEKGLVMVSGEEKILRYEALDYAGLMSYIARKQREMKSLENQFSEAASAFDALRVGQIQKTKIRFFEGLNGIRNVYAEILSDIKKEPGLVTLLTIWPIERLEKIHPEFFDDTADFNLPNLTQRDIVYESDLIKKYSDRYRKSSAKHSYKIWPKKKGEFPTDTLCWLDKVAFTDVSGSPTGIVIENKSNADTFRMLFEQLWQSL